MIELELEFKGRGSCKGFTYTQIYYGRGIYVYKVDACGLIHYEIFPRLESKASTAVIDGVEINFEEKVLYPSNESFGKKAWTAFTESQVIDSFKSALRYIRLKKELENDEI